MDFQEQQKTRKGIMVRPHNNGERLLCAIFGNPMNKGWWSLKSYQEVTK